MRSIVLILFLCASMYAQQMPQEWWNGKYNAKGRLIEAGADSSQKAMAAECYKTGKQYGRGHTLATIALGESSLGKDTNHAENSIGPFGISGRFITMPLIELQQRLFRIRDYAVYRRLAEINRGTFEGQAVLALCLFEDNIKYFTRLGYSKREAYFWAYPRYCAGKNWWRFKRRGEVFRKRVNFLRTKFK